jgi:hypothetical protein
VEEDAYEGELAWRLSATIPCRPPVRRVRSFAKVKKVLRAAISHAVIRLRAVTTDSDPMILKTKPDAGYARMSGCDYVTANSDQRASKTAKICPSP